VIPPQAPLVHTSFLVQALPSLQPVPSVLLPPSTQVWAPVVQEVAPFLQTFGLVVQETPTVQATQAFELLQTRLVPQLAPVPFAVLSRQVMVPVVQLVMPV
jgi:hypothetical protein